jgi:hypothetical protein
MARELLQHPALMAELRNYLQSYRGEFFFGNTAADVQTISGQTRESTHSFDLPLRKSDQSPWEKLLTTHPTLSYAIKLSPEQGAFIAGYICHLQADWMWVEEIFVPVFGLSSKLAAFPKRLYLHNVLRAYMDRQIQPALNNGVWESFQQIKPDKWLPFVADSCLQEWIDCLAGQLQPGREIKTVDVFSKRQGIPPGEYTRLISSDQLMNEEIFSHISRDKLKEFEQRLLAANLSLLQAYLQDVLSLVD